MLFYKLSGKRCGEGNDPVLCGVTDETLTTFVFLLQGRMRVHIKYGVLDCD